MYRWILRACFFVWKAQYPLYKILSLLYNIIKKMTRKNGAVFAILSLFHKMRMGERAWGFFALLYKLLKIKKRLLDKRRARRYNIIECDSMPRDVLGQTQKAGRVCKKTEKDC